MGSVNGVSAHEFTKCFSVWITRGSFTFIRSSIWTSTTIIWTSSTKATLMEHFDIARRTKILNDVIGLPRDFNQDLNWAIENEALWGASEDFVHDCVMAFW